MGKKKCLMLMLVMVLSLRTVNVYGAWKSDERGNYITDGGLNTLDGKTAVTDDEIRALEESLKYDYVKVTKEEIEEVTDNGYWWEAYLDDRFGLYGVYVMKETMSDAREEMEKNGYLETYTDEELMFGTVVISYASVYSRQKAGGTYGIETDDEHKNGYLLIRTPVDADLKFRFVTGDYYCVVSVKKGDTLLKVRQGAYNLVEIEGREGLTENELLPYRNLIQIEGQNTKEEPYVVELEELEKSLGIYEDAEKGETEQNTQEEAEQGNSADMEESTAVVVAENEEKNAQKISPWQIWLVVILITGSAVMIGLKERDEKKKKEEEYEEEDEDEV